MKLQEFRNKLVVRIHSSQFVDNCLFFARINCQVIASIFADLVESVMLEIRMR